MSEANLSPRSGWVTQLGSGRHCKPPRGVRGAAPENFAILDSIWAKLGHSEHVILRHFIQFCKQFFAPQIKKGKFWANFQFQQPSYLMRTFKSEQNVTNRQTKLSPLSRSKVEEVEPITLKAWTKREKQTDEIVSTILFESGGSWGNHPEAPPQSFCPSPLWLWLDGKAKIFRHITRAAVGHIFLEVG